MAYHDPLCTVGDLLGDFFRHAFPMSRAYVLAVLAEENVSVYFGDC